MTNDIFQNVPNAKILSLDEKEGLIQSHTLSRGELNRAEQANILEAAEWVLTRDRDVTQVKFLNMLNKRMFGHVWNWAVKYRKTRKNVCVDAYRIREEVKLLCDDCAYWRDNSVYSPD